MFQHTRAFWVALIALTFPIYAYAYKPALHEAFSEQSWLQATQPKQYRLGNQQFTLKGLDVGAVFGPEFNRQDLLYREPIDRSKFPKATGDYIDRQGSARDLIGWGAIWEDEATAAPWSQRPFNHFYDVQNDRGLTLELPLWRPPGGDPYTYFISSVIPPGAEVILHPGPAIGNSSPVWALGLNNTGLKLNFANLTTFERNNSSYRMARFFFYQALIGQNKESRKMWMESAYIALGHVLHHIQDMGQPQHVRNDMHCDGCGPLNDESGLEASTGSDPVTIRRLVAQAANSYDHPVIFGHPRDYWTNAAGTGMAQFTSHNFVSTESMFEPINPSAGLQGSSLLTSIKPHRNYPLPSVKALYLHETTFEEAAKSSALPINGEIINRLKGAKMSFVGNRVTDTLTGTTHSIDKFATVSVFGHDLKDNGAFIPANMDVLSLNHLNYSDHIKVLFPRILAFGEGFIRYFFRIQLAVTGIGLKDNRYRVTFTNKTILAPGFDKSLDGRFAIYAEYSNGMRYKIGEFVGRLDEGASRTVEGQLSSTAEPIAVVVVFDGSQGLEPQSWGEITAYGGGYGKFTAYPDEEESYTPCNPVWPIAENNYIYGTLIQLGSRPGTVRLHYSFGDKPIEVMVIHGNLVVAATGGFRTGSGTLSFYYNPAAHNNNDYVMLFINAPQGGLAWTLRMECPAN